MASRGLDVDDVCNILQFDLPKRLETLVHRAGRAARAGRSGSCVCLVAPWEAKIADMIISRGVRCDVFNSSCVEPQSYPRSREIVFLRTQMNKLKAIVDKNTAHSGAAVTSKMNQKLQAQMTQIAAQISPLEAAEDICNATKLKAFDVPVSAELRELAKTDDAFFKV